MRRTYFYLMLLMFNALGSMFNELRAQDENAAFYIYQNDGDFDGFFFDEVVRMGYSKFGIILCPWRVEQEVHREHLGGAPFDFISAK